MHVSVAPACNIQCHYCNRKFDCANECRPGVSSERLTPSEAVRKVLAVAKAVPQFSVVGIAGPGDALANPQATFQTLEGVARAAPDLHLCLSTNGLALPEHVDRIVALGVEHVTITVNMLDPEVGERIYPWALWKGRRLRGREASHLLADRQLEGLERLVEKNVLVKVNSVVIPGVNDEHLVEVSRMVKGKGAFLHNVMPLVTGTGYGTHYEQIGQRGPTPEELERVQSDCEENSRLMRHCRQCRADAVGMLSDDRREKFCVRNLPPEPAQDAPEVRVAYRATVAQRLVERGAALQVAAARLSTLPAQVRGRVAVATHGGGLVNEHFGHAREFLVYDVSRDGVRLVGTRRIEQYCSGGDGAEDVLASVIRALADCAAVLVAKIGRCPREELARAGIAPVDGHAFEPIEIAILAWFDSWVRAPRTTAVDAA